MVYQCFSWFHDVSWFRFFVWWYRKNCICLNSVRVVRSLRLWPLRSPQFLEDRLCLSKRRKRRKQRKRSTSARWIAEAAARAPPEHSLELPDRAASHSAPPSAEMMLMMLSMCHKSCINAMVRYSVSWETQRTSANFSKIQASSCLGERGQVTWNVLRRMCALKRYSLTISVGVLICSIQHGLSYVCVQRLWRHPQIMLAKNSRTCSHWAKSQQLNNVAKMLAC